MPIINQIVAVKNSVLRHLGSANDELLAPLRVRDSVLRQLGIADNDGLARLKHSLLLPHTPSQGRESCANSNFNDRVRDLSPPDPTWIHLNSTSVRESLKDTIAESSDPEKTFKSLSYLDQIALVCLAAGFRECQASDCLQYREKLKSVVPECHSWPGLRDWALCITSCASRTARDINREPNLLKGGGPWQSWRYSVEDLIPRFRNYIYACLSLTDRENSWGMAERASEVDNVVGTDESGLTSHLRPTSNVSSRRCPVLPLKF